VQHPSVRVGEIEIAVVCEGYAPFDVAGEMPGADVDWKAERARHPWSFHDERSWAWHVHAFALRTPTGVVMVDAGLSPFPPAEPWAVHESLERALEDRGVDPAEVRMVIHTHLHADHAGGAVVEGEPRFPNATHAAHPADWAFFEGQDDLEEYAARGAMQRLADLNLLDLRPEDREVWPGVRVVHSPGHTPGHRSVVVGDGADVLLLTGDLLHLPYEVANPSAPSSHDEDVEQACRSRGRLLDEARTEGWRVGVTHFGDPFGRVGSDGWMGTDA
jgi:glyoxylase-like metal-dependent hydrolase (beta-lactamase superfamily II)